MPIAMDHLDERPLQVLFVGDGNFSFSLALCQLLWSRQIRLKPTLTVSTHEAVDSEQVKLRDLEGSFRELAVSSEGDNGRQQEKKQKNEKSKKVEVAREYKTETALQFLGLDHPRDIYITSTSFDSRTEVVRKYPESRGILERLERYPHVQVLHDINAWLLADQFPGKLFDMIIWNHPHLGLEDFRLHRFLLAHFLNSAKGSLAEGGAVIVSLVDGQEERWNLIGQAARAGLRLAEMRGFDSLDYPGYEAKRNKTGESFKNIATQKHMGNSMSSHTYRFTVAGSGESANVDLQTLYMPVNSWVQKKPPPKFDFHCTHCGKGFTTKRGVQIHTRQVHELKKYGEDWKPEMPRTIPCPKCQDELFADDTALWQHTVARHSGDDVMKPQKPITDALKPDEDGGVLCNVCGQRFPEQWGMAGHLESLKPLIGLSVQCSLCPQTFTEHRALHQHFKFCRLHVRPEQVVEVAA
eukprot:comp18854_c1_seq1/m.20892 comp18854_c1_seq1/g.20892  ORF comp18854_c1_seq1/g.20892 comp18854_c1_seq1/m.20892 type:complete len:467 (-) comp18854_c1_seq1:378-1778(-)